MDTDTVSEDIDDDAEVIKEPTEAFKHAVKFYGILHEAAKDEPLPGNRVVRVYRGKITETYRSLGISMSFYSAIRKILVDTGSISIIAQGARSAPTQIVLFNPPTIEAFSALRSTKINLTQKIDLATMSQRLDDLQSQIGSIRVVDALLDIDNRLKRVEGIVEELQGVVEIFVQPPPRPGRRSSL